MRDIQQYKTALDANNAYWMARISKEIYTKISEENNAPGKTKILKSLQDDDGDFISVSAIDKGNTEAALIEHQKYLCMVFRGTDESEDWLDNILILPTKKLFGEFHKGFWDATEEVWDGLYRKYEEKDKEKTRPLFITGHSLGGAMATIAAAKLIHLDKPFTSVYTFGQPRVMKSETAELFNDKGKARFFRFQNNNDIVTRVPPRKMEYSHVGETLYISEEKEIHKDPGFWFKFLDKVDGYAAALKEKRIDIIEDHDMGDYLAAIERGQFV